MRARLPKKVLAFALCLTLGLSSTLIAVADEETSAGQVVGEPIADVSGNETSASGNDVSGSDVTSGDAAIVLTAETGDTLIKLTADAGAFPEGVVLSAEKVALPQTTETAIEEASAEKGAVVKSYQAYDIKVLLDGEEIQPAEGKNVMVTFEGAALDVSVDEDVDIYHVPDDTNEVVKVETTEAENTEDVVMLTNHFSTYVIVITNSAAKIINVTIQHYLKDNYGKVTEDIFLPEVKELKTDEVLNLNIEDSSAYKVSKIVKVDGYGKETELTQEEIEDGITSLKDITIRIYYMAIDSTWKSEAAFFDYDLGGATLDSGKIVPDQYSVNYERNYTDKQSERIAMGNHGDKVIGYYNSQKDYIGFNSITKYEKGRSVKINANNGGGADTQSSNRRPIVTGLLKGLTGSNFENVEFNYADPGFFSADVKNGKTIYSDRFELEFKQSGDMYDFTGAKDTIANVFTAASATNNSFFPLNHLDSKDGNNEYFGMRFDFDFKVGNYNGPLDYTFTGDDDLWVCLDGEVILDLGGEHSGYPYNAYKYFADDAGNIKTLTIDGKKTTFTEAWPNTVDLWDVLGGKENCDREATHRITVLYMERGGGDSNCSMNFTIPSVQAVDSVISTKPKADITINKVNEEGVAINGAQFQLRNEDGNVVTVDGEETVAAGTVTYTGLRSGTYTLTEVNAPIGYTKGGPWTIVVEDGIASVSGDGILATDTSNSFNVVNKPYEIKIEQNKSAKAYLNGNHITEDDRMFQIDLDASSLVTQTTGGGKVPVDVVLVLDVSGSMEYKYITVSNEYKETLQQSQTYYFVEEGITYKIQYNQRNGWRVWSGSIGSSSGSISWSNRTSYNPAIYPDRIYYTKCSASSEKRIAAMNNAVKMFLAALGEASSESNVAIVTFADNKTAKIAAAMQNVNEPGLVNALPAKGNGGTYVGQGLEMAGSAFTLNTGNPQHVILLSDGYPDGEGDFNGKYQSGLLKAKGITIHTIGFAVNSSTKSYLDYISTSGSSYSASDAQALVENLNLIIESTQTAVEIPGVTIVDSIDERFVPVDADGNILPAGTVFENGAVLKQDGTGKYYIEWNGTLKPKDQSGASGWKLTFFVKAKEDFMGGNMVPTNGEAYITVQNKRFDFADKPTVNVKPLDVAFGDDNVTLFLGEMITPSKFIKKWAEGKGLDLNENQITELLKNKSLEVPYSYTDNEGKYVYTLTVNDTADHTALQTGEAENYSLSVQYVPASIAERAAALGDSYQRPSTDQADPSFDNIEYTGSQRAEGSYKVNVVAGSIAVTKKIKKSDINYTQGDPIFTFKLEGKAANGNVDEDVTLYKAVRFSESAAVETDGGYVILTVVFDGLKKGSYTVTELSAIRYDLNGLTAEGMGGNPVTLSSSADGAAKFALGMTQDFAVSQIAAAELDNADRLSARDGKAVFSNDKTGTSTKLTDTDVVKNTFSVKDGKVTSITGDWLDGKTTGTN